MNKPILQQLLSGDQITRYDARRNNGTESLHSIISHLRNNKKYPIKSKTVSRTDAKGQRKHVSLYFMDRRYLEIRMPNAEFNLIADNEFDDGGK